MFSGAFFVTLLVGIYLFKNDKKLFGAQRENPSETPGGRSYNKMQVWAIWLHAMVLTGAFALMLH